MSAEVEERCEKTELLKYSCAHCRGEDGQGSGGSPIEIGAVIRARYETRCARDRKHGIESGDIIARTEDGWICEACLEDQ